MWLDASSSPTSITHHKWLILASTSCTSKENEPNKAKMWHKPYPMQNKLIKNIENTLWGHTNDGMLNRMNAFRKYSFPNVMDLQYSYTEPFRKDFFTLTRTLLLRWCVSCTPLSKFSPAALVPANLIVLINRLILPVHVIPHPSHWVRIIGSPRTQWCHSKPVWKRLYIYGQSSNENTDIVHLVRNANLQLYT